MAGQNAFCREIGESPHSLQAIRLAHQA